MPTYFRFLTLMAFKVFLHEGVDAAVVEVGLGGRYDATNILPRPRVCPHRVCDPKRTPTGARGQVCGITLLGLEHTSILGDTLSQIAFQKAGIFKPGVPVGAAQRPLSCARAHFRHAPCAGRHCAAAAGCCHDATAGGPRGDPARPPAPQTRTTAKPLSGDRWAPQV